MIINGDKVSLREINIKDTENVVKWRNSVRKNFFIQEELTEQQHEMWIQSKVNSGQVVQFIIIENDSKLEIGSVFLRDIDYKNKKAEYGIFIGEECLRGKGFGTEVAKLICKYGFDNLKLHKIFLRVFSQNLNAKRSYVKAGFREEGLLKDDIYIDGKFFDVVIMSKISG